MENGYKKGHEGLKPAKPVYVFKVTREVYNGLAEAAKATGTNPNSITKWAKAEKEVNGMIFSFNSELGQNIKSF